MNGCGGCRKRITTGIVTTNGYIECRISSQIDYRQPKRYKDYRLKHGTSVRRTVYIKTNGITDSGITTDATRDINRTTRFSGVHNVICGNVINRNRCSRNQCQPYALTWWSR